MRNIYSIYKEHYKALISLGLPIVIGQIGVIVLGFADTLMIGHHSTIELGAASFVNNVFNLVIIFSTGFSYGLTPIVGGLYGTHQYASAGQALRNSLLANLLVAFLLTIGMTVLYFILTIDDPNIRIRSHRQVKFNAVPFVLFFLLFIGFIFAGEGYAITPEGNIALVPYKYFYNLIEMPLNALIFIIGVAGVLYGIIRNWIFPRWTKGIWFAGAGTVLTVIALLILAGFNQTAFYPSYVDPDSSLTIYNASSSLYTLKAMSYVSIIIPVVIAYIWYAWRTMTRKAIDKQELEESENKY